MITLTLSHNDQDTDYPALSTLTYDLLNFTIILCTLHKYGNNDNSFSLFIRPPVYGSNGRTYKMLVMFFFFRQVPSAVHRPIAVKLCHMIGNWFH